MVHGDVRELLNGVIETNLAVAGSECVAWLGSAIGPAVFQVGAEVRVLSSKNRRFESAFKYYDSRKHLADIYQIVRIILAEYGRMATLIWRQ